MKLARTLKKIKWWGILEYALGITAVMALFLFIYVRMNFELSDPDIWLHLKTGQYIVQHHAIPRVDTFSAVVSGKEWIDHSWLTQVIFYFVFKFGGADNLITLSAIIVTLAFWMLFSTAYKWSRHLVLIAPLLLITILASTTRFNIRPENFSLLFFSIFLYILTRRIRSRLILLLPVIQVFWVNCHGFYILGPFLAGVFILAEQLKNNRALPWGWSKVEPLDARSYKNLKKVFLWVCAASFLNPYGYKGALYPIWVIFNTTGKSGIFYHYIRELLPTWHFAKIYQFYYILAGFSLAAFAINFKKINLVHLLLWLFFLAASVSINRNVIFFNFIAFLSTTNSLKRKLGINKIRLPHLKKYIPGRTLRPLKCLILIFITLFLFKRVNAILNSSYYIFEEGRTKSSLLGVTVTDYPQKAADFIVKNDLPNNLFNMFNDGSYLIWRLAPKKKVFIDGRTELYGGYFFENYEKILNVNKNTIVSLFAKYDVNTALLSEPFLDSRGLGRYFYNSPDWALVYFDTDALIFLKNSPQSRALIGKLKVDLANWQVTKADIKKLGLKKVSPTPYLKRAWIFYYLGLNKQALTEAKEALRILPSSADAHNIIARVYLKRKLYTLAFESLRLARIYNPLHEETLINVGSFYMKTGRTADAIDCYKKLTKASPYFSEGWYLLSHAYSKMDKIKLAIRSLERAIKINPYRPKYYQELAGLFYQDKRPLEAIRLYQKAVSLGLDTEHLYENLKE